MKVRRHMVAAGFAAMIVALAACGSDNEATRIGGGRASTADYGIGETVRLSNLEVIIHGVADPFDAGATKPAEGRRFVSVDAEVRNRASDPRLVSPYSSFELKDGEDDTYIPISLAGERFDGQIPAGGTSRGRVTFELPAGRNAVELVFKNLEYGSSTNIALG